MTQEMIIFVMITVLFGIGSFRKSKKAAPPAKTAVKATFHANGLNP